MARLVEHDEGIRADTTLEKLAALPAQPGTEVMTAGNSSQLSDGASAVVLASAERAGEIHEAFAAQVLAVLREFETQTGIAIPDERLNPNGGAVALGHPFGDSGTRCVPTLATELHERGARYGCIGICVGSGQGVAAVLERI